MESKTLKTIEFDKILQILAEFTSSQNAKTYALTLTPSSDINRIKSLQNETSQMAKVIVQKGPIPFSTIYDIRAFVKMAQKQMILKIKDLLKVSKSLHQSQIAKSYIEKFEDVPSLTYFTQNIVDLRCVTGEIDRCIISEDEIADDATEKLRSIRRRKKTLNEKIKTHLEKIVSSPHYASILQDSIITTRNSRYVVPIKSEHRASFDGIIHDSSSSGATLFIEPTAIVNMNNTITTLSKEEEEEIEQILKNLTAMIEENSEEIIVNMEMTEKLDFINAKAILSSRMNALEPKINKEKRIYLRKARHPLIPSSDVVPLTIKIGEDYKVLVITGPNTGGKTVALKTVSLLSAMFQSGLHLPCEYGSDMCVFDNIFADIGDEQSISQNLSTFSSHMTNIVAILKEATPYSLVVFDELGAGTDPLEGAALAQSILEYLRSLNTMTLASTHYSELKNYALTTDGVENASMEFDVDTLSPTYKMVIGIPGKSNAFEISRKLGLKDKIIDKAKDYLNKSDIKMEDILAKLQQERKTYEEKMENIEKIEQENIIENTRLKNLIKRHQEKKDKEIQNAKNRAKSIVKNAKEQSDILIREISKLRENMINANDKDIQNLRDRARTLEDRYSSSLKVSLKKTDTYLPLADIKVGDTVYVPSFSQNATIVSIDKKDIKVKIGNLTINVKKDNIAAPKKEKNKAYVSTSKVSIKDKEISPQIDLRGKDLESALLDLDKYIDDAVLFGLGQVTIVHGMGTYTLKNGIIEYLKKHKNVHKFEDDPVSKGGATVVEFK